MPFAGADVVSQKEVELAAGRLLFRQDEFVLTRPAASTVGFNKDWLDIKEEQHSGAGQAPPNPAQTAQNGEALRVVADEFAPDAGEVDAPFFNHWRTVSRLTRRTTRSLIK